MGYAHGSLLKERAQDMLNSVWSYFELQVVEIETWANAADNPALLPPI